MNNATCANCIYFHRNVDLSNVSKVGGTCHRYPPTGYPIGNQSGQVAIASIRPPVEGPESCGEFLRANEDNE